MENQPSGDNVDKVVALGRRGSDKRDWSEVLKRLGETGDRACFVALFGYFAPRVKAYIMRLGLTESTADELTQETMLAVWRKAALYDPGKAAASTWIFTLARNQSIDRMRKQKYPEYELEEWVPEASGPDMAEQTLDAHRLAGALQDLPENQAQVIYMSFYEGRSHSEIADRLGIPLGSVKSRMRLASDKLKKIWRVGS